MLSHFPYFTCSSSFSIYWLEFLILEVILVLARFLHSHSGLEVHCVVVAKKMKILVIVDLFSKNPEKAFSSNTKFRSVYYSILDFSQVLTVFLNSAESNE